MMKLMLLTTYLYINVIKNKSECVFDRFPYAETHDANLFVEQLCA